MKFLLTALCVVLSTSISASSLEDYFQILSKTHIDYNPDGAVCEQVALIEIEPFYPQNEFKIMNSIQYGDDKKTIGELDLVIFSKTTGMAEAIAEVKCWKSYEGGLKKAKEQRMRFLNHLNKKIIITDKDEKKYSKEIFKQVKRFFTISQQGGANQGFDVELSLDLKELMKLRGMLLDCSAQGRCPAR